MRLNFIHKEHNPKLLLIFPGWSCDSSLFPDFQMPGWDVAIAEEADIPEFNQEDLASYPTIYLIAWSLGVFWAEQCRIASLITAAYAVNGTLYPAHDTEGIPKKIFSDTASNLSPRNLMKFRKRMAGDSEIFHTFFSSMSTENEYIEVLRNQLMDILNGMGSVEMTLPWQRAYIGLADAIFPPANQLRHWKKLGVETIETPGSHFIDLNKVISDNIPDIEKVATRFSNAGKTYNKEAVVQRRMASDLAEVFLKRRPNDKGRFAEIGAGTGLFTAQYLNGVKPAEIDFVDISNVRPSAPQLKDGTIHCNYHIADAEVWMASSEQRFDVILSAATLQWLSNLPNFIADCASHLAPDGIMAFSIFLPGNLEELDALRPTPLLYHSGEEIVEAMEPYFSDIQWYADEMHIEFPGPRELLRHLQMTGIAGSSDSGSNWMRLRRIRSLTYRYGYFSGKKK